MANVIKHKRGSGSDPAANNLVLGELAIRTDTGKLFTKMDSGAIAEIAGGGSDIAINTLSSSSGTGGGSATFNGSAYRFTLSQPPNVSAAQLLVSINGVIQKPVAGTGQPSEGFSVDGTDIILGDAPATGSDFFILTFKSLGVSEPADNSVTSAKIVDGAIVNADINASAAIDGSKISPTFTSDLIISNALPKIFLTDTGHNPDYSLKNQNGAFVIHDTTNGVDRLKVNTDGHIDIAGNLDVGAGIDVTGTITGTGDLTIDTNTLHVDSTNNRIGIGTASPASPIHSHLASSDANRIRVTNSTTGATASDGFIVGLTSAEEGIVWNYENSDMLFGTNNAERMRIDSSGKVIVKTNGINLENATATNSRTYSITNAAGTTGWTFGNGVIASAHQFVIYDNTAGAARMLIDSSGRVLIGQTSGSSPLCVSGTDPVIAELHHSDGGTNDQARISLGALANNPPSNRGVNLIAKNNGAGHDFVVACSASHSAGPTERIRVTSAGHLFHNCTSFPSSSDPGTAIIKDGNQGEIRIATNSTAQAVLIRLINPNGIVGDIRTSGSGIIINGTSDYRVKENAVAISDGISRIKTLKPYRFNFKADPTKTLDGFFAHEVTAVPEAITGTKDEVASEDDDSLGVKQGDPIYQGIDQSKLVPLLVAALQEAIGRIEALEAK
jgi:hypothetical protein